MASAQDIRRWAYVHEAGHAVVGFELGLLVSHVECDGAQGGCKLDFSDRAQRQIDELIRQDNAGEIGGSAFATLSAALWKPRLAALLAGMIAEGMHGSDAVLATLRGRDDLPTFFGIVCGFSKGLGTGPAHALSLKLYEEAHHIAYRELKKSGALVSDVADELERHGTLTEADLVRILR